jgi:ElaB/YqjD/DUF883 family membrane-anchored ribosome-binding protein
MGEGATAMNEYEKDPKLGYQPPDPNVTPQAGEAPWRPEQIERQIEMTRGRMSENIDELGDRLSPQHLKAQAKTAIQDAAANAVQNVGEQARRTGYHLVDMIRENPLPVIAVGAAATWLLTKRSPQGRVSGDRMARYAYTGPERRAYQARQQDSGVTRRARDTMSESRERVTDVAGDVSERTRELGGRARQQSVRLKSNLEQTMEESPLAVALGAAVLGLAAGFLLPGTEREDEVLGPTRDRLMDRAEVVAERVKDATIEAGRDVAETVQDQIEIHKPELEDVAQQATESIKEQVKSSARQVKAEAENAPRQASKDELDDIEG